MIEIEQPGPRATVQDLGRPGYRALGVGRSGAADVGSLRLANRLVGNLERTACLELTLGGLRARFAADALVAITGASCPIDVLGPYSSRGAHGKPLRTATMNAPFAVAAGETIRLGVPEQGLRTYIAVRGGIDVPHVLGSRSTDTLAGLGPAIVAVGERLAIGQETDAFPVVDVAALHDPQRPADLDEDRAGCVVLRVLPGPRDDMFVPGALDALTSSPYTVTGQVDRIGARLDGPELRRAGSGDLPSEGMVRGALQVPPDARPIILLADHPVTGGYPVIGVLCAADLDRAGQLRPGERVRFRVCAQV